MWLGGQHLPSSSYHTSSSKYLEVQRGLLARLFAAQVPRGITEAREHEGKQGCRVTDLDQRTWLWQQELWPSPGTR